PRARAGGGARGGGAPARARGGRPRGGGEGSYVYDVAVAEEHRGRGYGRDLMLLAERTAVAAGHRTLALHVFTANTPALRLYESMGYRPTDLNYGKELI
ncbi:GNAT family N-acetyltransferase, partial [Streptomyces sp. NPDC127110]|uniref:GNAT family N-acetyltransferase n=1 Tax=Streptomyces sp. NPDC127110 TaxID=3345362 RepID=UPI003634B4A9